MQLRQLRARTPRSGSTQYMNIILAAALILFLTGLMILANKVFYGPDLTAGKDVTLTDDEIKLVAKLFPPALDTLDNKKSGSAADNGSSTTSSIKENYTKRGIFRLPPYSGTDAIWINKTIENQIMQYDVGDIIYFERLTSNTDHHWLLDTLTDETVKLGRYNRVYGKCTHEGKIVLANGLKVKKAVEIRATIITKEDYENMPSSRQGIYRLTNNTNWFFDKTVKGNILLPKRGEWLLLENITAKGNWYGLRLPTAEGSDVITVRDNIYNTDRLMQDWRVMLHNDTDNKQEVLVRVTIIQ